LRHNFTPNQEFVLRDYVGGFGFQSHFEWQAVSVCALSRQFTGD
jgi:hypothetical protein